MIGDLYRSLSTLKKHAVFLSAECIYLQNANHYVHKKYLTDTPFVSFEENREWWIEGSAYTGH